MPIGFVASEIFFWVSHFLGLSFPFSFGVVLEHVSLAIHTLTVKPELVHLKHLFVRGSLEIKYLSEIASETQRLGFI